LNCGWASGYKAKSINENLKLSASIKRDKIVKCTNGETPRPFQAREVTNSTYKELIADAYYSYEEELKLQLESAVEQVRLSKQTLDKIKDKSSDLYIETLNAHLDWKKRIEKIEFSQKAILGMKKRVKENLLNLP